MKGKKTLLILGHPDKNSFSGEISKQYLASAKKAGKEIKVLNVIDMKFNPVEQQEKTEKDIIKAQELITWADHLVFVFPIWWGNMPALLKGFFDRVFMSGFAFKYLKKKGWAKLLKGKTSRIITTMNTPILVYKIFFQNPLKKNLKGILWFCGISPVKYTFFSPITRAGEGQRKKYLMQVRKIAKE